MLLKLRNKGSVQSFLLICFIIISSNTIFASDKDTIIRIGMLEKPIIFSREVDLVCNIRTNVKPEYMTWTRIPHGQNLAINNMSTNSTKYIISLQYGERDIIYKLKISDFDQSDVNAVYRCHSDFDFDSRLLQLNEKDFVAIPTDDNIKKLIDYKGGALVVNINITGVYPAPSCTLFFQNDNLTEELVMENDRLNLFYKTHMDLFYETTHCQGNIKLVCTVGRENLQINGFIDHCNDTEGNRFYGTNSHFKTQYIVIGIIVAVVVIGCFIISLLINCKKRNICGLQSICTKGNTRTDSDKTNINWNNNKIERQLFISNKKNKPVKPNDEMYK